MVLLICCTYNRHTCLERVVRFYLDQDYASASMLFIYNNSPINQQLNIAEKIPYHKKIILTNNYHDLQTGKRYENVGDIHRDAFQIAHSYCMPYMVNFFEDDNFYLPNHISEGVKGMEKAHERNCSAYKPEKSFLKSGESVWLEEDVMEPSIFVTDEAVNKYGFKKSSIDFHHSWIYSLINEGKYFVDKDGFPTMIYVSHENDGMSNLSANGNNGMVGMLRHRQRQKDSGDRLITPISKEEANKFYNLI